MPLIRRKKLGSILWTFDLNSKVQLKRVFNTEEKSSDWPIKELDRARYRDDSVKIDHVEFFNKLINVISKMQMDLLRNVKFKLIWALKRYPDDSSKIFAIFFEIRDLGDDVLNLLKNSNLILGKFAGYYVITRFNDLSFFEKAIEFYERFDQLVLPDISEPFVLFGNRTDQELVLLFYCDVNGNGMLIKSKSSESKISPEREIEILRLGSIIGVDIPQRSAVIKLDPEDDILNAFSAGQDNNILIQKLIPAAFPLYSANENDLAVLTKTNCVNLGKMIIFDIVAGSWDRHSGNYVLHPHGLNEYSLAEIDFGLFDPSWYPPADFNEPEDITLSTDETPPFFSHREGWALTRHPTVTEMVKNCDQKKVIKGMEHALRSLQHFISTHDNLTESFSSTLSERIVSLFKKDSKVRVLLESELEKLEINFDFFRPIFE